MGPQNRNYSIGLAGEFLVAGELLRRGIMAAVTYGNAKQADVVAVNGNKAAFLEVKSTPRTKWVLGNKLPEATKAIWVLVYLPSDSTQPPEYFVLTGAELRAIVQPEEDAFKARFRSKHGRDWDGKGVVSVQRKLIDDTHLGAWNKVARAVGL